MILAPHRRCGQTVDLLAEVRRCMHIHGVGPLCASELSWSVELDSLVTCNAAIGHRD